MKNTKQIINISMAFMLALSSSIQLLGMQSQQEEELEAMEQEELRQKTLLADKKVAQQRRAYNSALQREEMAYDEWTGAKANAGPVEIKQAYDEYEQARSITREEAQKLEQERQNSQKVNQEYKKWFETK